jgi:hypothetical protein
MSNVLAKHYRMGSEAGRVMSVMHGRPVINVHCVRRDDMREWKLGAPIGRSRGIGDQGVSFRRGVKSGDRVLEHDVHGGNDAGCNRVVYTVPMCVIRVANHDTAEILFAELARSLSGTFAKIVQPTTRNLDAPCST